MALFYEVQFPADVSRGARQGPMFMTLVTATANPAESRVGQWSSARMKFDVSYSIKSASQMSAVVAFFRMVQGRLAGFRFKDWTDYWSGAFPGTPEALANPYPAAEMQLTKTYSFNGFTNVRTIKKPVAGSYTVYENGTPLAEGTDYTMDTTTGLVLLSSPASGATYTALFQFDVPVRFDTDTFQFEAEDVDLRNIDSIPIIEVPL
jgi:uncharacterized protein (TIGR02217 family)